MAKIQTRRAVTMRIATYGRIKAYCEANGIAMSRLLEHCILEATNADLKEMLR